MSEWNFQLQRKRVAFFTIAFYDGCNFSFIARVFRAGHAAVNIISFVLFWYYVAQKEWTLITKKNEVIPK